MHDVIVVGARCAGSATALLLARKGYKVLIADRATFPSDTLSTHFLWPRGMSYLNRWGLMSTVLDKTPWGTRIEFARDDIRFRCETPVSTVEERLASVHGDGNGATSTYASVRRLVLDTLLLEAAVKAGAEFCPSFTVEELLWDDEKVVGVKGRLPNDKKVEERANVVVGADGRHSTVAKLVNAPISAIDEVCTFAYWTYFSGFELPCAMMEKKGRLALVMAHTNFNANMTLVFGPKDWLPQFKQDREKHFLSAISFVNPELGELVRQQGRQEEKLYGVTDQKAFKRKSRGPGWLLVGDAACIKDQCTAIGMTHAFRDAELAAQTIAGEREDFEAAHDSDLLDYYDFVGRMAKLSAASLDDLRFMRALTTDSHSANAFASMYGDSLPIPNFIDETRAKVLASAPADPGVKLLEGPELGSMIFQ